MQVTICICIQVAPPSADGVSSTALQQSLPRIMDSIFILIVFSFQVVPAHHGGCQRQQGQGEPEKLPRRRARARLAAVVAQRARARRPGLEVRLGLGVRLPRAARQEGAAGRQEPVVPRAVDF